MRFSKNNISDFVYIMFLIYILPNLISKRFDCTIVTFPTGDFYVKIIKICNLKLNILCLGITYIKN